MNSEQRASPTPGKPRSRSPRLVALTFVAAFAATILTIIYTGLLVEAPRTRISAALPTVTMAVGENRTVNLVFASSAELDDASLIVVLPEGIELLGYAGQKQVQWPTRLEVGNNILPVTLIARAPGTGQIVARLRHGEQEKIFRVHVDARAR